MKIIISITGLFFIIVFLLLSIIIHINRNQVYPSNFEIKRLNIFFYNKKVEKLEDIIEIQNKVVTEISHKNTGTGRLDINRTLKLKHGQCFDRSLLLQKYFLLKGLKIRPVYLFWGNDNSTSVYDFFCKNINSHNVFELCFKNKWYLIKTNTKIKKLESLNQYLMSGKTVPTHTKYIKYLNNRNGVFLYPSYIPDIYFF